MAARVLRAAAAAAAWFLAASPAAAAAVPEVAAEACLAVSEGRGNSCGVEQIELEEDASADFARVELLQRGLVRQKRAIGTEGLNETANATTDTGPNEAAADVVTQGVEHTVQGSPVHATDSANTDNIVAAAVGTAATLDAQVHEEALAALLVETGAAISRTAAAQQVRQLQLPDALKGIFGGAVDSATENLTNKIAQTLETSLNTSLNVVLDQVDDLPASCIQLREAMFEKINGTSGDVNASLASFDTAVTETIGSFLLLWSPVLLALEGLHAAVPAALRVAGLESLAQSADAALGAGPGLSGLAASLAASLRNISASVAGLAHASADVAGRQLAAANEAVEEFLAQADNFAAALLKQFSNITSAAADMLKVPSGTFSSIDETASAIVEDIADAAHELAQGINEASSLTGVEPDSPKGAAARVPERVLGWVVTAAFAVLSTSAA